MLTASGRRAHPNALAPTAVHRARIRCHGSLATDGDGPSPSLNCGNDWRRIMAWRRSRY